MSIGKEWQEETGADKGFRPPFNIDREARVFLYFPMDSDVAAVAFLAINAEFGPPTEQEKFFMRPREERGRLIQSAMIIWKSQYMQ